MVSPVDRKDDKRQLLLKWFKRVFGGPWLFRFLMIVWKLYDHFDR
ncbi:hypothetical protein SAMN04487782_2373 [Stenotrophomonas maltophilia]|jgi:hypothetical protein|nr:hypothetical protein SAMN04487782_2373 [Stenotrophomonas maltophilia]